MLSEDWIGEWGFAAIVEADGHRLLVDTGARPDTVLKNAQDLGVDLSTVTDVVLTHNHPPTDVRFEQRLACDSQTTVEYTLPVENLHAVMRRVAAAVPAGPGVVVAGDLLDLAMLSVHDVGRAVVLVLHGDHDYYYDLAVRHDRVVHAYVAYSRRMYERLLECLPHRADSIHYIPYGIPLPPRVRRPAGDGPLTHLGRMDSQIKILGHRVELGEVEAVVRGASGVDGVVAIGWPITSSGYGGIEVLIEGGPVDLDGLRAAVAALLPDYMVPRRWHVRSRLPRNANGKYDRKAMPAVLGDSQ